MRTQVKSRCGWGLVLLALLAGFGGCPSADSYDSGGGINGNTNGGTSSGTNGSTNSGGNTGNVGRLAAVRTNIPLHVQAELKTGDDLVVFGTGAVTGVAYIIPSAGDTAARAIPSSDDFSVHSFCVMGKKIALVKRDTFQVFIFDTATGALAEVPDTDVRLDSLPVGADGPGHIQCGGSFVATLNDRGEVTDGNHIKVIDASGATPVVIAFPSSSGEARNADQVAVDAALNKVVAVSNNLFLIYDITNPATAPVVFDASLNNNEGIDSDTQIAVNNGIILFKTSSNARMTVLNTFTGVFAPLTTERCILDPVLRGGSVGFFLTASAGGVFTSGIGKLTDAATTFANINDTLQPNSFNLGVLGFGGSIAITPDQGRWFIGGREDVGQGELLQVSTGGKFATIPDPAGQNAEGLLATDVNCDGNVVGFKVGDQQDTFVGYIRLQ